MRKIKCENQTTNIALEFGETAFTPFFLKAVDGLYSTDNTVYISQNTMTDGGTYQGSIANVRNIVLTIIDNPQTDFRYNQHNRDLLYSLFKKGEEGVLYYTENDVTRKIGYFVESISRAETGAKPFTISLKCPNPAFTDVSENHVSMADWLDEFEFIHEFVEEGEELGMRSAERLVNIVNDVAKNNIGLTITITATGNVTNPYITRVESGESIEIGSTSNPFEMTRGQVVVITTGLNNKHVKLVSGGVTTEINQYLTEDSQFIQLMFGNNNIAYGADNGQEYMVVEISYSYEYEAV